MAKAGTIAGDLQAFHNAAKEIKPPAHVKLRPCDYPFWEAIVRARAYDTWNDVDLAHAANLARTQADIEAVQADIDAEGFTLRNERGTVVANPKHSILETLSRRAVALSRMIHVHANATVGESREQPAKNKAQAKARQIHQSNDDDLIARPTH